MRGSGIEAQVSAIRILEEARASLVRLWGREQASSVTVASFAHGVLYVDVRSAHALQSLRASRARWVNETNRAVGSLAVTAVRTVRGEAV